ncbi:Cu/Pi carrier, partial [Coemansia sp. RSA 486]
MFPSSQTLNSAFKGTQKPFIAASPAEKGGIELNSAKYFYTCAAGGVLACGLTHFALTPLDMLKCRMQVNKNLYSGVFDGFKKVASAEGFKGLYLG